MPNKDQALCKFLYGKDWNIPLKKHKLQNENHKK